MLVQKDFIHLIFVYKLTAPGFANIVKSLFGNAYLSADLWFITILINLNLF